MSRPHLRALVLAAGRGERLRPLTDQLPKPLLPVAGQPVAGRTLAALAAAGCEAAAINLHHLGEAIRAGLGACFAGMPLTYSQEVRLLGTMGALGPLATFAGGADLLLVVNGDSLCRWPFARLLERHLESGADLTMLFARRAEPTAFGGGVAISRDGRVVAVQGRAVAEAAAAGARRRVYAGAQIFRPDLALERLPAPVRAPGGAGAAAGGFAPADFVASLWQPLLEAGRRLQAVETAAAWHDLGTPRRYLEGVLRWAASAGGRRSWLAPAVVREAGVRLRRAVVEAGCWLGADCRIENALLLPGARIGAGSIVREAIVGPGIELPPGSIVERRLVTRSPSAAAAKGLALTALG